MANQRTCGAALGATMTDGDLRSSTLIVGSDLRHANLDGRDLRHVRFIGCFLSGASFRGANLEGAELIACFAPEGWAPVDFTDAVLGGAVIRHNHIVEAGATEHFASRWPSAVAEAAKLLTSDQAQDRNRALALLAQQGFAESAPLIGYALEDAEWDVRQSALVALSRLRGHGFPSHDDVLMEWMFYALGDEVPAVAELMVEQIAVLLPGDAILRASIEQVDAPDPDDALSGLRAARRLVHADRSYLRLIDLSAIERLLRTATLAVRTEIPRLAGYIGGEEGLRLILASLSDRDAQIRVAALSAVALLDQRPHALQLAQHLTDPSEEVRVAAVYALNQCADFSTGLLTRVSTDPSSKVREAVAAVIDDRRRTD